MKQPSLDGISPYAYTNMAKAVQVGEYHKMGQYPVIFLAEHLHENHYIDTTSIDTLTAQKLWIETFSPNELKVHVELPKASHFVYLQNHYPAWKATINGKIVPIQRVSETFMSVELPKGKSTVEFVFEPTNVIRASFVSMAFWAGALVFLIVSGLQRFISNRNQPKTTNSSN